MLQLRAACAEEAPQPARARTTADASPIPLAASRAHPLSDLLHLQMRLRSLAAQVGDDDVDHPLATVPVPGAGGLGVGLL